MKPAIKKVVGLWAATLAVVFLSSCGEIFDTDGLIRPTSMKFDRNNITIMKGDSVRITLVFTPDSITSESAFWKVENPALARITSNGMLHALDVGETTVTATTVQSLLTDECHVNIINSWEDILNSSYPHDMVVYANVRHNGELPGENTIIAAFCGNECRGFGYRDTINDITYYTFRIWSPLTYGELIEFYVYDRTDYRLVKLDYSVVFDGETHGTLSNLIEISY
ncbi:MAG: Ig domain-containing protein [Muribaculaceae bacterium]